MRFPPSRIVTFFSVLGLGAVLGAVGPLAYKIDNPGFQVIGIIASSGWAWACFAFLVGYSRRSRIDSTLFPSVALAVGSVVYYTIKSLSPTVLGMQSGSVPTGFPEGISPQVLIWGVAAFIFGAPVGFVGNIARTRGIGGLPFRLLIPLIAFFEASQRLAAESQDLVLAASWTVTRIAAVITAVVLIGQTVWAWRRPHPGSNATC